MIQNTSELNKAIDLLEQKRKLQEQELVEQFRAIKERLKPGNILKNSLEKIGASQWLGPVLQTAGTIGVELLAAKLMGKPTGAGKKSLIKTAIKNSVSHSVIKNFDKLTAYGLSIYKNLIGTNEKKNE